MRSFARSRAMARPFSAQPQTAPEDLPNKVKDLLANRLDKTVFVKADARARYERVVDVVDNLRAAGVDQLGLLTEQKEPGKMEGDPPPRRLPSSQEKVFLKEQSYVNVRWRVGWS